MTDQQSDQRTPPPTSHTHLPGRMIGIVLTVKTREKGFVFLRGLNGQEYFSHVSGWVDMAKFGAAAVTGLAFIWGKHARRESAAGGPITSRV